MTVSLEWPSILPKPRLETHEFKPRPPVARTEVERGAVEQRRRFKQVPAEVPFSLVLNESEMGIFDAFVEHKAKYGAEWFAIDLLSGIGLSSHEARILTIETYEQLRVGRWLASGTFEVRDRPMFGADHLEIALDSDIFELLAVIEDFHDFVHTELGQ